MANLYDQAYLKIAEVGGREDKLNHLTWKQLEDIADVISLNSKTRILDTGCGPAGIARFFASKYKAQVLGIDHSVSMIEYAKTKSQKENLSHLVRFMVGELPEAVDTLDSFDVVLCFIWLAHMPNRRKAIAKLASKLSPGGYLIANDWLVSSNESHPLIDEINKGWHVYPMETPQSFRESFLAANLNVVKETDINAEFKQCWLTLLENVERGKQELEKCVPLDGLNE